MGQDVTRDEIRDFFFTLTGELAYYRYGNDAETLEHCYPLFYKKKLAGLAYYKPHTEGVKQLGIVIRKEMQGKGNGEKAIKGITEIAKENKVEELIAKVMQENERMKNLMEKLGWFGYENNPEYKMYKLTL
jgi:RimJ/RimL family protein N-acetyltransferase